MQNVRIGLSICVAGVATTNRVGHAYTKKVWHCPVLVKVGHIRRPKALMEAKPYGYAVKVGKLTLRGIQA